MSCSTKSEGSWNLIRQLPADMQHHVLLSSCVSVIGSRGQSNYAAGNTYQDALARFAASRGRKCITIDLGVMAEAGYVAENDNVRRLLAGQGYTSIRLSQFLRMLEVVCDPSYVPGSPTQAHIVTGLETPHSLKQKGLKKAFWMGKPIFRNLNNFGHSHGSVDVQDSVLVDYQARIHEAADAKEATSVVLEELKKKLSQTMMIDVDEINPSKQLFMLGVDSLIAVELRSWFAKVFAADVAVFNILQGSTAADLAQLVAELVKAS